MQITGAGAWFAAVLTAVRADEVADPAAPGVVADMKAVVGPVQDVALAPTTAQTAKLLTQATIVGMLEPAGTRLVVSVAKVAEDRHEGVALRAIPRMSHVRRTALIEAVRVAAAPTVETLAPRHGFPTELAKTRSPPR